jgi:hypothetical protein
LVTPIADTERMATTVQQPPKTQKLNFFF